MCIPENSPDCYPSCIVYITHDDKIWGTIRYFHTSHTIADVNAVLNYSTFKAQKAQSSTFLIVSDHSPGSLGFHSRLVKELILPTTVLISRVFVTLRIQIPQTYHIKRLKDLIKPNIYSTMSMYDFTHNALETFICNGEHSKTLIVQMKLQAL